MLVHSSFTNLCACIAVLYLMSFYWDNGPLRQQNGENWSQSVRAAYDQRIQYKLYSYVWCCSRVGTRLHHQSGYTDISYVGPVTSSLYRQPHLRHPSDADEDGRSCTLGRWSGTHFLLTFVVHPVWTLLRSFSNHICFLLITSYNNFFILATAYCWSARLERTSC